MRYHRHYMALMRHNCALSAQFAPHKVGLEGNPSVAMSRRFKLMTIPHEAGIPHPPGTPTASFRITGTPQNRMRGESKLSA